MAVIDDYEARVYAGVLGKVIGVYMGRPVEGMTKDRIEERFGTVDRYVHEEQKLALVTPDDDISGTLTFVRALEDSGLYAATPVEFFGDTWLNYLVEGKTVLWWGGMGVSTEHTAYLRLKHGIKAPLSGAAASNGAVVAEQIGAQIFIDAFGLVAPANPELAAMLARRSASVSHDGEAVHAALVVAAMVSAAFAEKDMNRLLDIGASAIPGDSLIARVHQDVRRWARQDRDWQRTHERICRRYGYDKYGGGCHVIPNHALMVMAWCHAPEDFYAAQVIINTAGWDTDCNAANVGAVMGVKLGLPGINRRYDFQSPMADRIILPTAEGARLCTDALAEALGIARIGRRLMGWAPLKPPKQGALHHFSMPGARHGYMSEEGDFRSRGAATVENVESPVAKGGRFLRLAFRDLAAGRVARVSTPVLPSASNAGTYKVTGMPRLYPGNSVSLHGMAGDRIGVGVRARLFVRHCGPAGAMAYGPARPLMPGKRFALNLEVPDARGWPVQDLGIEIRGRDRAAGEVFIDRVHLGGRPGFQIPGGLPLTPEGAPPGWMVDADRVWGTEHTSLLKNEGQGLVATGTRDWQDYSFTAEVGVHLAERAGILVRFQGLQRYVALLQTRHTLQLVMRYYRDIVLAEKRSPWEVDAWHKLRLVCKGEKIAAYRDGRKILEASDAKLGCGGAGLLCDTGYASFKRIAVQ